MIGSIIYFKYDLLIIFISSFLAYFSSHQAMKKYKNYHTPILAMLLTTIFTNTFLIIVMNLRGISSIHSALLILVMSLIIPYLAIRKFSSYKQISE
jgi:amino acid transporter